MRLQLALAWMLGTALLGLTLVGTTVLAQGDAEKEKLRARALSLNDVTGEDPVRGEIKTLVDDPANTKKLLTVAIAMAKEKEQPFAYNGALILAQTALRLKEFEASQTFFRICAEQAMKLQSGQKLVQSYSGLMTVIEQLYLDRRFEQSGKLAQEFLEMLERQGVSPAVKADVMRRMIRAFTKQGKVADATRMLDNLLKTRPDDFWNHELRAWFKRETNEAADAAKLYEELITRVGKEKSFNDDAKKELQNQIRYTLSGIYIDLEKVDEALTHLRALVALDPNHPTYNNDLGYILADNNRELDEAERMIRKALDEDRKLRKAVADLPRDEDKDNAAYLDSLGWVLFKKKKYEEAKKYLLEAIKDKQEGQHVEIFDHLGDVHMALGERAEALAIWKKALELEAPSKREQHRKTVIEKKIKGVK